MKNLGLVTSINANRSLRFLSPIEASSSRGHEIGPQFNVGLSDQQAAGLAVGMPFHHQHFVGHSPVRISA